jgi:polysaccharide export outer membrane protein
MFTNTPQRVALAAVLCLGLAACGSDDSRLSNTAPGGVLSAPDQVTFAQTQTEEYRIGPQDKLSINVYPVKDFSIPSTRVAADGTILLPAIGALPAQGKTTTQLGQEIQAKLAACCLQKPLVVVQVEETISQQLTVTGAVKVSNVYNLRGRTTLLQAISMAGGVDNTTANIKRVGVIRMTGGKRMGAVFNLADIQAGRAEDPEVFGGDQIIVDTSDRKSAWRATVQALPLASMFTLF